MAYARRLRNQPTKPARSTRGRSDSYRKYVRPFGHPRRSARLVITHNSEQHIPQKGARPQDNSNCSSNITEPLKSSSPYISRFVQTVGAGQSGRAYARYVRRPGLNPGPRLWHMKGKRRHWKASIPRLKPPAHFFGVTVSWPGGFGLIMRLFGLGVHVPHRSAHCGGVAYPELETWAIWLVRNSL